MQEQASSSEDEPEPPENSHSALLQLLNGYLEEKPARKKRKVTHFGRDEAIEAFKRGVPSVQNDKEPSGNTIEAAGVDETNEIVDEAVDSAGDDVQEDTEIIYDLEETGADEEDSKITAYFNAPAVI